VTLTYPNEGQGKNFRRVKEEGRLQRNGEDTVRGEATASPTVKKRMELGGETTGGE